MASKPTFQPPAIEKAYEKEQGVTSLDPSASLLKSSLPTVTSSTSYQDTTVPIKETDFKPQPDINRQIAVKYELCTPQLRFPLRPVKLRGAATYTPTSFNFFSVVHYMDQMIQQDEYFHREGQPWHPFISRIYFSIIFYIQTLRSMQYAKIASTDHKIFLDRFFDSYPPESLPIPGPLVPIVRSISASLPSDNTFGLLSPMLPNHLGPEVAHMLFPDNDSCLALPNLPFLFGMAGTYRDLVDGEIPDYTDPDTFSDIHQIIINGHDFMPDAWTPDDRNVLLQPGMTFVPETDHDIDDTFASQINTLDLPIIEENDDLRLVSDFLGLNDLEWFQYSRDIMASYCLKFKESTNLSTCSPFGPSSGQITSIMNTLTSLDPLENVINTLTQAFPNEYPVKLWYDHSSKEQTIPQLHKLMAQYSGLNASIDSDYLPRWNRINVYDIDRNGPYWQQQPDLMERISDKGFDEIENIITDHYYITN